MQSPWGGMQFFLKIDLERLDARVREEEVGGRHHCPKQRQDGIKDELVANQSCASSHAFKRLVPKPKRNLTETGRDE